MLYPRRRRQDLVKVFGADDHIQVITGHIFIKLGRMMHLMILM